MHVPDLVVRQVDADGRRTLRSLAQQPCVVSDRDDVSVRRALEQHVVACEAAAALRDALAVRAHEASACGRAACTGRLTAGHVHTGVQRRVNSCRRHR